MRIGISLSAAYVVQEFGEESVLTQRRFVSGNDELLAGTRERHVELAVYHQAVFLHAVGGEEVQLVGVLDGKRVDDNVALRPLIPLHGVDGYAGEWLDAHLLNLATYHGYLVAVGHDDAYRAVGIEAFATVGVYPPDYPGYYPRLYGVDLV